MSIFVEAVKQEKIDKELLKMAHEQVHKRFGSPCKHEKVRGGRCLDCFRKVRDKL